MQIKILNRWSAEVIFECEAESMKLAVKLAIEKGVSLASANLRSADLIYANLSNADLSYADLSYANLSAADLSDADLRSANLRSANLRSADLRSANLSVLRDDFWAVLSAEPMGVPYLREALVAGKVNGSCYESECQQACLVGSLAYGVKRHYEKLEILKPNASRPAERFFLSIQPGHTPDNSQFAKLAVEWIDAWPPMKFMQFTQAVS